ncbi:MAG: amylo-alpha-1,6-glucosidase [Firmicutes bacterium]|nr:amylo-alpha-1,6-glucosidase [Alicyclobacillaceae bacterium]MCL6497390.1 amylo-alpha-1,6-glucosidase [Bacillota bacterium]
MPFEVSVGPPGLTIHQGGTFLVCDLGGEIGQGWEEGLYAADTRFLSRYRLTINGLAWQQVTSSATSYFAARVHALNPLIPGEEGDIPPGVVALVLHRAVGEGVHEDLDLTNYGDQAVRLHLEIRLESDFADLFEVKSRRLVRRGQLETQWNPETQTVSTRYRHGAFERAYHYQVARSDSPPYYANGRLTFVVTLPPRGRWHACGYHLLEYDGRVHAPLHGCADDPGDTALDCLQREWIARTTKLATDVEDLAHLYRQAVEDLGGLRLHHQDMGRDLWIPAAGVPWFVTVFGRDSLIAALQTMWVEPRFALGTLQKLAQLQAQALDPWRDAEPGKMPHEIRFGELAQLNRVPHARYYGTADATPLYCILLHETWRWLGDPSLLHTYRETLEGCLQWIDRWGDLDGDGFQEYRTRSPQGYENMGWKDSGDAIVDPAGQNVPQPKALCELQGYVYDAWRRAAEIFWALDEGERARGLVEKAERLRVAVETRFWIEAEGTYALALDPQKRPVATVASNAGHLLWSGLCAPDRAHRVVRRLFAEDLWSGWGIRTLSSANPAYNPYAYQRGAVWPHDNGIIALGCARYGCYAEAGRIARAILDAARLFVSYRLPELFAGVPRDPHGFPVQYLGANVPQAWAAGSVFHLVQALVGLRADAPRGRLWVDPHLPDWLARLELQGLRVGTAVLDLAVERRGEATTWTAKVHRGTVMVAEAPWGPWSDSGGAG